MNWALNLDSVSTDIQVNNGIVVLGKDESELLEADARKAILADVDLGKLLIVFQDFSYHR